MQEPRGRIVGLVHGTEEPVAELTPFLAELVLGIEEELGETGDAVYITAARRGDEERQPP